MTVLRWIIRYRRSYLAFSALLVLLVVSVVVWRSNLDLEKKRELPLARSLATLASTIESGTINSQAMGAAILLGLEHREVKQLAAGALPPDAPIVLSGLDAIREQFTANAVFLVNEQGLVVADSREGGRSTTGLDMSSWPCIQLAIQGTPNVYPVMGGAESDRGIYLAAPLRASGSRASRAIGAVVVRVGADKLDMLLESWTDGIALLSSPQREVFSANRLDWLFGRTTVNRVADAHRAGRAGVAQTGYPRLSFSLEAPETTIEGVRYAVRSQLLEWNDPAGDWRLVLLGRTVPWWTDGRVLSLAGLAGLLVALLLFWFYTLARHENELLKSDALLKESQNIAALGSYVLDTQTGVFEVSGETDVLFGIDGTYDHSVAGWLALIHPDDRAMMERYFNDQITGQSPSFDREYRILRYNDQQERWVRGLGRMIFDSAGRPLKMHGTIQDVTDRKQAEQVLNESIRQLKEKELAKTRFLAAAGHDLRQPLAAANLFIDALKFTGPTPDQNKIIQRLDQAMGTFNGLLEALLNISKLDAGVIKPEYTPIQVPKLLDWLEQSFSAMAHEKGLGFKTRSSMKEALVICSDLDLLKSVLMNLVSNAIKFTTSGAILVSARRRGEEVLFQVWDTGIGIDPEHLENIFDEFYQINNPQRDRTSGLGLGLAIVNRALMLLGVEVTCRSKIGIGSVFGFRLPLARASDMETHQSATVTSRNEAIDELFARGKRFIVVEDDRLVAQAMVNCLEAMGGEVVYFKNAEEALQHANIEFGDYYIADYMLGGRLNGIQLLNQLRQRMGRHIKAVLLTGDTSPAFIREAEDCNWPVLHKPVNTSRLISSLSAQQESAR
ncbi:MAG TPA: ATP-binding protein [Gallionella sp.]|nr:ATP-binding protein [Gallionella sp.]